jgi:hypothetical protein
MIEIGDILEIKPKEETGRVMGSVNGFIPDGAFFLVVPPPKHCHSHPDYVWVEPIITEGVPHQICLDYVEKV